jgi:cellulose synthase (UDP-forming)
MSKVGGLLTLTDKLPWAARLVTIPFAAAAAFAVITVPLDLRGQIMFGVVTMIGIWLMDRVKSRHATLVICVATALVSTRYIFWRTTHTLEFDTLLEFLMGVGLYLAELYAWVILILGFIQTSWPLKRPIVVLEGEDDQLPFVDVYIPTYNEGLTIVRNTVFAAMALDYPKHRFKVYILDDGKRPEFREFARIANCGYLTRSDNLDAKAGNLNAAMKKTDGALICVFDCDHVPTRAFLQMTVGWFQKDPKLAVLQTPHYFYSPDPVQRNVHVAADMPGEGELFYGAVQSGNDLWNATFFCGSCAVIRREALKMTNGFAGETVTEDAHTALKLQRMGWNTAYINARLSAGLATERLALHIGQRVRWARGMTQIMRIDNPLFGPGLTIWQRLCYINAMLHFQFPLPRIVFLTSPLAYLLAGRNVIHASAVMIFAYALPHLLASTKSSERLQGNQRRPFWGEINETLVAFHLVKPTVYTLFNPHKGKFNVTDKGGLLDKGYFDAHTLRPHLITAGLLIFGVIAGFGRLLFPDTFEVNIGTLLLNTSWTVFNLLILTAAIAVGKEARQLRKDVRFDAKLPISIYFEDGHIIDGETEDVSMGGLGIALPKNVDIAGRTVTDVGLPLEGRVLMVPVEAVAIVGKSARVRFKTLSIDQQRRLVGALMGRADAWQSLGRSDSKPEAGVHSFWEIMKVTAATILPSRKQGKSTRAIAAALAAIFVIVGALALFGGGAYAQGSKAPAKAVATAAPTGGAGIRQQRLTLKVLRVADRIRLQGTQGEFGIPFGVRRDEVVTGASVTLNFAHSPSLLPDLSQLVILVNGEVVRALPLTRDTSNGTSITIPIEPALFLAGDNRLNIRLVGHYTRDCEDPLNSTLWANISNTRSFIDLTTQRLPFALDLKNLPAPFFDTHEGSTLSIPFVFAGSPGNGELEAAASVASWLGSLASYRGFAFKPTAGAIPMGNAIVFLKSGKPIGGLDHAVNGPSIAVVANPRDPLGSLLLVMGRDDAELKRAAGVLATRAGILGGMQVAVDGYSLPVRRPYDAPRWLRGDRPVQLGELVDPLSLQGRGLPPGPLTASFRIAPDLFFWPRQGAHLNVGYRYPTGAWLDRRNSRLDVSLNGQYLNTLPMSGPGWVGRLMGTNGTASAHSEGKSILPSYSLFGQNELSFYYDLHKVDLGRCHGQMPTEVKSSIDPTSTIDVTSAYHATRLPNLAYFAGAGFPFTRVADMGETAVLLAANPSADEIEAFLGMMGRFGDATGAAATRVTVVRDANSDQLAGKDILVVGPTALAGSELFAQSPARWNGSSFRVEARSPIERVFNFLSPVETDQPGDVEDAMQATDSFAGIISFRSPFDSDHSVVALLATQPSQLPQLVYSLLDIKTNAQVQGDVAVVTDDGVRSFRSGPTYWSGSLPFWLAWAFWFSERPLLLGVLALIAAILIAGPIYLFLKAQERRRLAQVSE